MALLPTSSTDKVSLVCEGINNKIRHNDSLCYLMKYLKLKIVAISSPLPRNANINPHVSAVTVIASAPVFLTINRACVDECSFIWAW